MKQRSDALLSMEEWEGLWPRFGVDTDPKIAADLGCSGSLVHLYRNRLGGPAAPAPPPPRWGKRYGPHPLRHGTAGYVEGCRCEACTAAATAVKLRSRQRKIDGLRGPVPAHLHGRISGYVEWGCRCAPCCEANHVASRAKYARHKARVAAAS